MKTHLLNHQAIPPDGTFTTSPQKESAAQANRPKMTIVLVHSAWLGKWQWNAIVPHLEKEGHRVITPDLPGHGEDQQGTIRAAKLEEQTAEEKKAFKEAMEINRERISPKELINKPFPELEFTDLEGNFYNLTALKGKVVVLNFWFINCKPCVKEIPELNEIVEHFKGQREVVFLAFAKDDPEKLAAFLSKKPYQYKIIPNSKPFFQQLRIDTFPTHMIIDQEGIIRFHQTSYLPDTKQTLITQIEKQLQ